MIWKQAAIIIPKMFGHTPLGPPLYFKTHKQAVDSAVHQRMIELSVFLNFPLLAQYVLPTDSPQLSKQFFKMAISPVMWARHKPDRFDTWSAGE